MEFSFLNGNLIAPASRPSIFIYDTFPNGGGTNVWQFESELRRGTIILYLVMAATYFRQATRARRSHVRNTLRDLGREYAINADRKVPVHERPDCGLHPFTSNTQS